MEFTLLLFVGLFAGTLGSLAGLGGGVIIVPALLFIDHIFGDAIDISPQLAVGTSLAVIVANGLASTHSYLKRKTIDFSSGWLFSLGSIPGAIMGAIVNRWFADNLFYLLFGILSVFIYTVMVKKDRFTLANINWPIQKTFTDPKGNEYTYGYSRPVAITVAFFVGGLSGLFGIGGGALLVPMMLCLFRFPAHVAVATSMFVILTSSLVSTAIHAIQGNVYWLYVLALAPGAWAGGKLGPMIASRLSGPAVERCFKLIFLLIAIRMVLKGGGIG
jgi:hypothetical protein